MIESNPDPRAFDYSDDDPTVQVTAPLMRSEFRLVTLNSRGAGLALALSEVMSRALSDVQALVGSLGRDQALVRTKMQEAFYWARRAIVEDETNRGPDYGGPTNEVG